MTRRRDGTAEPPGFPEIRSPDLARLDRDLREIVIEERSSFAAELRAELAAEQARLLSATSPYSGWVRPARLTAAAVVLLAAGTLLVPEIRTSMAGLLLPAAEMSGPVTEAEPVAADPSGAAAVLYVVPETGEPPEAETRDDASPPPDPNEERAPDGPPPAPTLPDILDRDQARRTVAKEYPVSLQEAGVGGVVRMLFWVRPDGVAETPEVRNSSGVPRLDQAALRAARSIRFQPATRLGLPVGTWVQFSIRFVPNARGSQPAPENQTFEIPPIN